MTLEAFDRDAIVASQAAQEIIDGYQALTEPVWDGDSPVKHTVEVPSLIGVPHSTTVDHQTSYGEPVNLRKGRGVIATLLVDKGVYTGEVSVQPACDDFDM